MKWHRINAMIRRHLMQMCKDMSRIFDMLYWPMVDIILWGFTSTWLQKSGNTENVLNILLSALVLWGVVWRSQVDISLSLLEELISKNIVNLFSTPLTLLEWMSSMMILGFFRSLSVLLYTTLLVWLFYGWNIFLLGTTLIPYVMLLMVSGWALGFFIASFLVYYGQRISSVVWAVGWLFSIVGAVFYPVEVLPSWLATLSKFFPLVYVFEAMRIQLKTGQLAYDYWLLAALLSTGYLVAAFLAFRYAFKKSCEYGLARLEIN